MVGSEPQLGLVDGGQVTAGHHAVGVVHVDEGPHHHGLVGGILAEVAGSQVL